MSRIFSDEMSGRTRTFLAAYLFTLLIGLTAGLYVICVLVLAAFEIDIGPGFNLGAPIFINVMAMLASKVLMRWSYRKDLAQP